MGTERLKRSLDSSVSALINEHKRVETELIELEKRKMASQNDPDSLVRAMAQQVAADEAKLAEKRALLAKAEEHRRVLSRDNAAAAEARRLAELDAAKQALRAEADAYLSDFAALVRHLRGAAHSVATLQARMREIGLWSQSLSPDGRAPAICDRVAHEKRLAFLVAHCMRRIPGHRERLGDLAWPSFADAEHPVGLDPVETERVRLQRHVLDVLATEA